MRLSSSRRFSCVLFCTLKVVWVALFSGLSSWCGRGAVFWYRFFHVGHCLYTLCALANASGLQQGLPTQLESFRSTLRAEQL